ncbi:hypothetical protein [Streptomyces sp. GC420]|uniref:hypothetical protein n=1 Tax=Streptomyces sp. GC420 TaxID=2697568 RepID=UPI001414DA11|nr:hypothetical protein [Streptomyces sp. GC420]NBM18944.1 hypothetical protein [Streptomyces sp. GC420]
MTEDSGKIGGLDVVSWAAQFRMAEFGRRPGDVLCLGDMEVAFHLARRRGVYVLEYVSGSTARQGCGSFSDLEGAARLLVISLGRAGRAERKLPPLVGTVPEQVAIEEGPVSAHLTWDGGWADLPVSRFRLGVNRLFAHSVTHSLPDLAASFVHPRGAPVFAPGPAG